MTEYQISKDTPDVTSEACAWIAQLETGGLTLEDLAAFREWIGRSPRHADEIRRLAHLSYDINVLTEMAGSLMQISESMRPIVKSGARLWFSRSRLAILAALALAVSAAVILQFRGIAPAEHHVVMSTEVGGYLEKKLPDGTVVRLNTNSQIEIDYEHDRRNIRLFRGEAYFQVAHNPDSPFLVFVQDRFVRAVGTAFVVRLTEQDVEVTVTDGRVEIAQVPANLKSVAIDPAGGRPGNEENTNAGDRPAVTLVASQSLTFSSFSLESPIKDISERDLVRELSWQERLLDFSQTPLTEVVEEMSRYTRTRIEFADPEIGALVFGGIFRTGETGALFEALEMSFNIEVEYVSEDLVRLHKTKAQTE